MLLLSTALAADMSWTCNTLTSPDVARPYVEADVDAGPSTLALVEAWNDCPVSACTDPSSGSLSCEVASCTTAAGAVVSWRQETTVDWPDGTADYRETIEGTVAPTDQSWSWLSVSYERAYGGDGARERWIASWTGTLDPAWPTDGGFSAEAAGGGDGHGLSGSTRSWDDGACRWLAVASIGDEASYRVAVGDDQVDVSLGDWDRCDSHGPEDDAWLDSVYLGTVDLETWEITSPDEDGDGCAAVDDCDDADPARSPLVHESCNGVDDNCDGRIDNSVAGRSAPSDALRWYTDLDHDGWGYDDAPNFSCTPLPDSSLRRGDCADLNAAAHPDADEVCNGIDDNCDGVVDNHPLDGRPWYLDSDGDGYGAGFGATRACVAPTGTVSRAGDCDDSRPGVSPAASERPNGRDDDCDELVDEE